MISTANNLVLNELKKNCVFRLNEGVRMIEKSLRFVEEASFWQKPNPSLNSIGNLMLHLCGNISQYVISGVGGQADRRNRNAEFETEWAGSKEEILSQLKSVTLEAIAIIEGASEKQLIQSYTIQGFKMSGVGAIIHAVEHFSYHTGQIALWVKYLKNEDLGFYDGMNLEALNE